MNQTFIIIATVTGIITVLHLIAPDFIESVNNSVSLIISLFTLLTVLKQEQKRSNKNNNQSKNNKNKQSKKNNKRKK